MGLCRNLYVTVCVCVCVIQNNFPKELALFYRCPYFKKINIDRFFHVSENCEHDLLYRLMCHRVSVFLFRGLFFQPRLKDEYSSEAHVKNLLNKIYFSVHITHSSQYFTWFVLLNHQRFDNRPLFTPEAFCLIIRKIELPQKLYFCEIKDIFAIKQSRITQILQL